MRRHFVPALALVQADHVLVVDGQTTVRVDGDAEQPRVSLRQKNTLTLTSFVYRER